MLRTKPDDTRARLVGYEMVKQPKYETVDVQACTSTVCLLYWYNCTNSDAAGLQVPVDKPVEKIVEKVVYVDREVHVVRF